MDINSADDLMQALKENDFFIFGTGYVAENFFKALKKRGLLKRLKGFVVSLADTHKKEGIDVRGIDEIGFNESLICLAVHDSIRGDIEELLKAKHVNNYVWVYPFLFDLLLGTPVENKRMVDLSTIYMSNADNLIVPIRYLAIEEYYGGRTDGYRIYLRCMELSCKPETAQKRLKQFEGLILAVEQNGFDKNYPISVLENYKHIDGTHRLALALYRMEKNISCKVYPMSMNQCEIHGLGGIIRENDIITKIGDYKVLDSIKETCLRIEDNLKRRITI